MPQQARDFRSEYLALSPNVREAIRLFRRNPRQPSSFEHHPEICPIATAFLVRATRLWKNLVKGDRRELIRTGWTGRIYRSFISWFDTEDVTEIEAEEQVGKERETIIRWCLRQDRLPRVPRTR